MRSFRNVFDPKGHERAARKLPDIFRVAIVLDELGIETTSDVPLGFTPRRREPNNGHRAVKVGAPDVKAL